VKRSGWAMLLLGRYLARGASSGGTLLRLPQEDMMSWGRKSNKSDHVRARWDQIVVGRDN
jgi:hypothetical protein